MKQEIKIPPMGESITEATIGKILKNGGVFVQESEEIIELETEKVNQVLYAAGPGLLNWSVKEGETVKVGDVIGFIEDTKESQEEIKPKAEDKSIPNENKEPLEKIHLESSGSGRRLMTAAFVKELTRPSQTQTQAAQPVLVQNKKETRRPLSKIRKTIANRLVESLHTAAMLTTFNEVDMSAIMHLRTKYREAFIEKYGVKLGLMSFFVKAIVEGLKAYPDFNAYLDQDEIVNRNYFDMGIAVGAEKGLVVPVIRDCDGLSFAEIEKKIGLFAKKAAESKLSIEDLKGGGFTITNGGIYGSMLSTPILNPPQVGILGMHKITDRPVVVDHAIVIRPMMYIALSYDHRLIDGKEAISFLVHVKDILEDPARLLFIESDGKI